MSLHCGYDGADVSAEWWWLWDKEDASQLATKRDRKCCSRGEPIAAGELAHKIRRIRGPKSEVEVKIHGEDDEIPMADWHLCETCGALTSLDSATP